jgi:hypothetical protein
MLNTLVDFANEYMGSQWAVFTPTVVKEPLKALVNEWFVHKGVYHNPS